MTRYAVNIADLIAIDVPFGPMFLLKDFVDSNNLVAVRTDKQQLDSAAVVLNGPAAEDEERLVAMLQLLQHSLGPRKIRRRVRCYVQGARGGWRRYVAPSIGTGGTNEESTDCFPR